MAHPSARASRLHPFSIIWFRTTGLLSTLVCLWFAIANPHFDLCALHVKAIVINICCGTRGFKLRDPICLHPDHPTTSLISQSTLWSVMINQLSLWTLVEECWPSKGRHAPHDGMAHSDSKPNSLVWWLKESKYSPSCTLWSWCTGCAVHNIIKC